MWPNSLSLAWYTSSRYHLLHLCVQMYRLFVPPVVWYIICCVMCHLKYTLMSSCDLILFHWHNIHHHISPYIITSTYVSHHPSTYSLTYRKWRLPVTAPWHIMWPNSLSPVWHTSLLHLHHKVSPLITSLPILWHTESGDCRWRRVTNDTLTHPVT